MRAILLHPTKLEPGDFHFERGVTVYRIITPKELKRYNACIHIVEVDTDFQQIERVHSLTVKKCFGTYQRNEARTLANHINNMRDISFCNRHECTRRKTCERYLPKDVGGDDLFTFILIEDAANCKYYFPKFIPEFAACKLDCSRRETCTRAKEGEFSISNKEWTEKDMNNCLYYEEKNDGPNA